MGSHEWSIHVVASTLLLCASASEVVDAHRVIVPGVSSSIGAVPLGWSEVKRSLMGSPSTAVTVSITVALKLDENGVCVPPRF